MNIKEAKEEICRTVTAYTAKNEAGLYRIPAVRQRPILLVGAPGIGKTAIVEQAAAQCQVAFLSYTMTHHTRQSAVGLPQLKERTFQGTPVSVTEYTMSEIIAGVYRVMEETGLREGILFLDEINCVSETLMPSMLQFLQFKTFGSHALPEGWIIAAAGNPPRYNRSAREFDVVTLDRVKYMELDADLDTWREYALAQNIHSAILSYLTLKPEHFYVFRHTEKGREFVTPRSWEDLSRILETYEALQLQTTDALFSQYLQCESVSREFASYYRLSQKLSGNAFLPALTETGAFPRTAGSLSALPFDEKLCLIEYLIHSIHRQCSDHENKRQLRLSLSYFSDRLAVENPAFSDLETVCEEILARRRAAFLKRKEFGLLPREEEARELLLADRIRQYAADLRLSALQALEGQDDDCKSSDQPDGGCTAAAAMKMRIERDARQLEENGIRLETMIRSCCRFISEQFGDTPEAFLFFTELMEHPETERFFNTRLQDLKTRIQDILAL